MLFKRITNSIFNTAYDALTGSGTLCENKTQFVKGTSQRVASQGINGFRLEMGVFKIFSLNMNEKIFKISGFSLETMQKILGKILKKYGKNFKFSRNFEQKY